MQAGPGPRVPIVMYHSIGDPDAGWPWHDLTCPRELFTDQIKALAAAGFRAVGLDDVVRQQHAGRLDDRRQVVFTFDDGYLDTWTIAYPVMKRLGWRGTVYVNPEFVDPGCETRPTLEDVWAGRITRDALPVRGFLNWAEIAALDTSGFVEIASHSMSHTWYPIGPEIVDFHRPDGGYYPWLAWNARPERKFAYLSEDQSHFVPWGTPVHVHGRSLGIRRYLPDPAIAERTVALVAREGGAEFFRRPDWRERLLREAAAADTGAGRYETDEEMADRFRREIVDSLSVLSERLGRPVRHFCWPGGAYCDESWRIALEANVASLTVRRSDRRRWMSDDPRVLRRISDHQSFAVLGRTVRRTVPGVLVAACRAEAGVLLGTWRYRLRKVVAALVG